MAQNFLSDLKMTLGNCIAELDEIHFMFCKNPEAGFTRNRKLSFYDYIQFMLQMQSKSVSNEILDFFEHSLSALQNLLLHSRGSNFNLKDGISCSIYLSHSAGDCLSSFFTAIDFWHVMVLMST